MPIASHFLFRSIASVILLSLTPHASAWSEGGHHLIGLIAYHLLDAEQKAAFQAMLAEHPRFAEDFEPPGNVANADRWRAGRAGYWPDVARSQPAYNRPNWHWEDAVTLVIGDRAAVQLPNHVTRLPRLADLDSKDLHASQAIALCQRVMGDATETPSDRALALCWLGHLVGDVHQPCHAGSLYAAVAFPGGDRGGNSIETKQRGNLHALWDGLLGPGYSETSENRRFGDIVNDAELMARGEKAAQRRDPLVWMDESRLASVKVVYTNEVLAPVRAVAEGRAEAMPVVSVSPEYLETAGRMATLRACHAGWRLAAVWRAGLATPIDRTISSTRPSDSVTSMVATMAPADTNTTAVGSYWLNTKTGVRHNANCRNFENTKGGRRCSAGEGKPCGICGG